MHRLFEDTHVDWDPVVQYTFVSWISWVGNLVIAEALIVDVFGRLFEKSRSTILRSEG